MTLPCACRLTPRRRGFTLVELVATIVVLGIISVMTSNMLLTASDGYLRASAASQLHAELSLALERMSHELQSIAIDPEVGGHAPDIDAFTATSIAWDGDSEIELAGAELRLRVDGGPDHRLLGDVSAFLVECFDDSGVEVAPGGDLTAVRRVRLTVSLSRHGSSVALRTLVFIRSTALGDGGAS